MGQTSLVFLDTKMAVAVFPLTQLPHSISDFTRLNEAILIQLQFKTLKRVVGQNVAFSHYISTTYTIYSGFLQSKDMLHF